MEPDRRNRISDLYHQALARTPAERAAFLNGACDGDEGLRQEVESLLGYESASSRFLETPAAAVVAASRAQMVNRQLGSYTIVAPLGAGGMGEVYRARDSKLGRDVAIKILPSHFTADPERRARFAREARLLATLNHPHIGAIYGLEESDGVTALVLELVEGPTLADRLDRGPLAISEAIAIARQIAEALDEAHEKGVVHRDLKPANIVLQGAAGPVAGDIRAKVLDFGLAKTLATSGHDITQHQTRSSGATAEGRILGTPAYMSPEQARGLAVDKRTDIWAFGCVLFEMLSGRRAFDGETMTDTFARILEHDPDWSALPAETPASIRTLLDRCLRKDARKRLHDIADALIDIDDGTQPIASTRSAADVAPGVLRRGRQWLGWIVAAPLAVALIGTILLNDRGAQTRTPELVEFPILPPEGADFARPEFAVSPDGRLVAFVAASKAVPSLWVRSFAAADPRPLPGTEGARQPFWSPDSQSIGFFAGNQLKTVHANGRSPVVSVSSSVSFPWPGAAGGGATPTGTWNRQGVVVFGPSFEGKLYQVNVNKGSTPTPVTTPETTGRHLWPAFLPDGQHFVYSSRTAKSQTELRVGSLAMSDTVATALFEHWKGAYASGHLLFERGGNLMAQPFNADRLELHGDPVSLGVQVSNQMGVQGFSVSATGRLVVLPPPRTEPQLTWLDRRGRTLSIVGDPGVFTNIDVSPNGQRIAADRLIAHPGGRPEVDIWLMDLASGRATRLTDDPDSDTDPAWSRDGKHIVFNSNRTGSGLFMRAADASGIDVPIMNTDDARHLVASWSRDDILIFNVVGKDGVSDLWTRSMSGDGTPKVFVSSRHNELNGAFSPDGRWVAYQTNASGRYEVVVRPFPNGDPAQPISRDGGICPRWRGDGKELFFLSPDGWMVAAGFDPTTGLARGVPEKLFPTRIAIGHNRPYAVDKNGERFLMAIAADPRVIAVLDWRALLDR